LYSHSVQIPSSEADCDKFASGDIELTTLEEEDEENQETNSLKEESPNVL